MGVRQYDIELRAMNESRSVVGVVFLVADVDVHVFQGGYGSDTADCCNSESIPEEEEQEGA